MRKKKEVSPEFKEVLKESKEEVIKDFKTMAEDHKKKVYKDFEEGILHLSNYEAVKKFKSIRRAIRRGHVSIFGELYPHRPFNNSKCAHNSITYRKRFIYAQVKGKNRIY